MNRCRQANRFQPCRFARPRLAPERHLDCPPRRRRTVGLRMESCSAIRRLALDRRRPRLIAESRRRHYLTDRQEWIAQGYRR